MPPACAATKHRPNQYPSTDPSCGTGVDTECRLAGDQASAPLAFRAATLAVHTASALLLAAATARVLRLTQPSRAPAWHTDAAATLAAAVWATHPLRVEVVAWPSGQPYALAGLCGLIAVHCLLLFALPQQPPERPPAGLRQPGPDKETAGAAPSGRRWLCALVLALQCAILCKSSALTLPAAAVAAEYLCWRNWPPAPTAPRQRRRLGWWGRAVLLASAVPPAWVAAAASGDQMQLMAPALVPLSAAGRLARAAQAGASYLLRTAAPIELAPVYNLPGTRRAAGVPPCPQWE
jgi:hypothetical protein